MAVVSPEMQQEERVEIREGVRGNEDMQDHVKSPEKGRSKYCCDLM